MRIASVTLAHPLSAGVIEDALESASWCDWHVVIGTGEEGENDELRAVADAAINEGRWYEVPWRDDFAGMRNEALALAAQPVLLGVETGAGQLTKPDWLLILDTDERIICADPGMLRQALAQIGAQANAASSWYINGEYSKPRLIKVPITGEFVGATHEYWEPKGQAVALLPRELIAFEELTKSPDDLREKYARDARLLTLETAKHPEEWRPWHYLGVTYEGMGDLANAADAFQTAMSKDMQGQREWGSRGWSAFRGAQVALALGQYERALSVAVVGFAVYPIPELLLTMGQAHYSMRRPDLALQYAMLAADAGMFEGWGQRVRRAGSQFPPALYELPYELMALCFTAMGNREAAQASEQQMGLALAARVAIEEGARGGPPADDEAGAGAGVAAGGNGADRGSLFIPERTPRLL